MEDVRNKIEERKGMEDIRNKIGQR